MPTIAISTSSGRLLGCVHISPKSGTVHRDTINGERLGTIGESGSLVTATNTTGTSLVFASQPKALAWLWQIHAAQERLGQLSAAAG